MEVSDILGSDEDLGLSEGITPSFTLYNPDNEGKGEKYYLLDPEQRAFGDSLVTAGQEVYTTLQENQKALVDTYDTGTSQKELAKYLSAKLKSKFFGAVPADELPMPKYLKKGSCLIANYSMRRTGGTKEPGHWVAMGNLNNDKSPPWFFDSTGEMPDAYSASFALPTPFRVYLDYLSKYNGHKGKVLMNHFSFQPANDYYDTCGEWCAYACVYGFPFRSTGSVSTKWKPFIKPEDGSYIINRMIVKRMKLRPLDRVPLMTFDSSDAETLPEKALPPIATETRKSKKRSSEVELFNPLAKRNPFDSKLKKPSPFAPAPAAKVPDWGDMYGMDTEEDF